MRASVWTAESEGLKVGKRRVTNEQSSSTKLKRKGGREGGGVSDEIVCPSGSTLIGM